MKLDVNVLRYLDRDEFRTLTAVEMGQKNHEIVPAQLVDTIAGLKHGGAFKCLKTLLRHKLVHHDSQKYDGYRLTTLGYDFLAIRALTARGAIASVGRQIGVGKESDVFEVADDEGRVMALKLHRLGRTSFRAVKNKRDYLKRGSHFSWLYLSRLAALKEFAFMHALHEAGLPVPEAIEVNRHAVLMQRVDAVPLVQVRELAHPARVYAACMESLTQLARLGLVHCDFNEFNLLINDAEEVTLIDFPQMVSTGHANAEELFDRDVAGVVKFFSRKLGYRPEEDAALGGTPWPVFKDAVARSVGSLDEVTRASGFKREHQAALDRFAAEAAERDGGSGGGESASGSEVASDEEGDEGALSGGAAGLGARPSESGSGDVATGRDVGLGVEAGAGAADDGGEVGQASGCASARGSTSSSASGGGSTRQQRSSRKVAGVVGGMLAAGDVSSGSGSDQSAQRTAPVAARTNTGGVAAAELDDDARRQPGDSMDARAPGLALQCDDRNDDDDDDADGGGIAHGVGDEAAASQSVAMRLNAQRRRAARQATLSKASRNTSKAKNKGKRREGGATAEWG